MSAKKYRIIAGLGNPGSQYENTPHNIGFMVANQLAEKHGFSLKKKNLMPFTAPAPSRITRFS